MQYHAYEMAHAALAPLRWQCKYLKKSLKSPLNPLAHTFPGKMVAASCEVFNRVTKRYGKPEWGLESTRVDGVEVPLIEEVVSKSAFCDLLHLRKATRKPGAADQPKTLIIAPMSGHYATLLRGTVTAMLPEHDVYITDWRDARDIPLVMGRFDLNDFIDHIIAFIEHLGENTHVVAVCQPAVPALIAAAVMAADENPLRPASITLMGGPIDTRRNPTVVNEHAERRDIGWFERNVIMQVPWPNLGALRRVYPGFIQLTGFMTMNLDRHLEAHSNLFSNLIKGDADPVEQHRRFYDEYLSVMDLPAEFFLQTVQSVFQEHALPKDEFIHRGRKVDCSAIRDIALLTVEGERDDICGLGQTEAAHDLCDRLPDDLHFHYVQEGVGHYGVFNGTRWRTEIQPRIRDMIKSVEARIAGKPRNVRRLRVA